jgi:hypothetical protein
MIECDMADEPSSGFTNTVITDRAARPAKLTYDRFLQLYWPHFPQTLSKGLGRRALILLNMVVYDCPCLDPSMVFSEFMGASKRGIRHVLKLTWSLIGVIMGSEETLTGESSYLDRDGYLNLSERAQSTFAQQRQRVYSLFEAYLNQKRLLRDIDPADR